MMRRGQNRYRGMLVLVLLCSLLLCGFGSYQEGDQRVFDQAELLSEVEEQVIQQEIETWIQKLEMDIVVVTTSDAMGKSTRDYADDYYDQNGFGYGDSYGPGILFLIDMDNREYYISTAGRAIVEFTDDEIDRMLDDIYYWMAEGRWYDACMEFVEQVDVYAYNEEISQDGYYDEATDTFVEYTEAELKAMRRKLAMERILSPASIIGKLVIAMVIGAVGVLIMRINVNRNATPGGNVYMKPGSERILQHYDRKINTTVTHRRIPRNNTSGGTRSGGGGGGHTSVHRSSGGRSHGGGGRGF